MRGAGSDLVADLEVEGERIDGRIAGESVSVDLVLALVDEVRALLPDDPEAPPTRLARETWRWPSSACASTAAKPRAWPWRSASTGRDIEVPRFAFDTYEGRVSGLFALLEQPDASRRLVLTADVDRVTGRFLDDFFFEESPRAIRGIFTGKLVFNGPVGDAKSMLADAAPAI